MRLIIKISQLYTDYSIKSYPIIVFYDEIALYSLSFIYFYMLYTFGRFYGVMTVEQLLLRIIRVLYNLGVNIMWASALSFSFLI